MKIFISADMEGIEGLSSWSDMEGPAKAANYALAQREVGWVVDALLSSPGGDSIEEMRPRFESLRRLRLKDLPMDDRPWRFGYE